MGDQSEGRSGVALREGYVLAGVSVGGFLLAYVYEANYAGYFAVPSEFIRVTVEDIARSVGVMALIALGFSFLYLPLASRAGENNWSPLRIEVTAALPMLFVMGVASFAVGPWFLILFVLVPMGLNLLLPLLGRKGRKTYRDRYTERLEETEKTRFHAHILDRLFGRHGRTAALLYAAALLLAMNLGISHAKHRTDFWVIQDGGALGLSGTAETRWVVLLQSGTQAVLGRCELDKHLLTRERRYIDLGAHPSLALQNVRLGELEVQAIDSIMSNAENE